MDEKSRRAGKSQSAEMDGLIFSQPDCWKTGPGRSLYVGQHSWKQRPHAVNRNKDDGDANQKGGSQSRKVPMERPRWISVISKLQFSPMDLGNSDRTRMGVGYMVVLQKAPFAPKGNIML